MQHSSTTNALCHAMWRVVCAFIVALLAGLMLISSPALAADADRDGISNAIDNCPNTYNPGQRDADSDGIGNACDTQDNRDFDGDGIQNYQDTCPNEAGQASNGCPLPRVSVIDHGATPNDQSNDTDAIEGAMNAAGAGTVTYIPAGTYRVHDVNIPSNTELEVDSGATIKHYGTNNGALFTLQGVQNTNFAQDVYVRGVGGRFTVDLVDGGSSITAFRVRSVEGFSIENVDIINQADGDSGDTLKPNISFLPMDTTKLGTKWEHARDGLIKNAHAFDAAYGWGLTQLTGAENVHFENISSEGGSALRVENFESNATTIDGITADGVTCTNGKNPVNFNPHQAVNGTVSVSGVVADSCSEVIRFGWDSAYNTGDFSDVDITGARMIAGTMAQIRTTGLGTWEYGNSTRCADADANLPYASSVTITSLDCGGLPHKNWPQ